MTLVSSDFGFWSRAVLGALWCEGQGSSAEELAEELNVPLERLLPVIEVLVARRVVRLDASDVVDGLELVPAQGLLPATRLRLASIA